MDTPFDLTVTDKLLSTTRAVRKRLDFTKSVDKQTILDCIALSQQAPTASNSQTWRWMVVTDAQKRRQIADIYKDLTVLIQQSREQAQDQQTKRVYDSAEYLLENMEKVPAMVFPCVLGRLPPNSDSCISASIYGSIFPAVWNFQLALRSRGLGSVLTTLHLLKEQEVAALLNIPEEVMQVAMLPVAYTIGTDFKPAQRPDAQSITYFDTWGK